jgi:Ricin-type beta-trefoil lectin domain
VGGWRTMSEQRAGQELSEPEQRFSRRWRELVDRAGGQSRVVNRLKWSSSTTSRDYRGKTLPTDDRARQLCTFLSLERAGQEELLRLLEQARPAYDARRQGPGPGIAADVAAPRDRPVEMAAGPVPEAARNEGPWPDQSSGGWTRSRGHGRLLALTSAALAVTVIAVAVLTFLRQPGHASDVPVARGSYHGLDVKAIPLKGSLLTSAVAAGLRHGGAAGKEGIDGYAFRNIKNPGLCLTAVDTGPGAGKSRDRVDIEACDYASNQVWIPEQWEARGSRFTQLVSFRYQSKCLNAQYIGGLANGHKTMLWNCYRSPNEYWDFGDWYESVKSRGQAYPIFVQSAPLCLDADKFDFGNGGDGAPVNIWDQYSTANQFWS